MEKKSMRVAYGEALIKMGHKYENVVVLDADLAHATMTNLFQSEFPDRFFNVGIAEQNLMGMAAGFALAGNIPFASTFALFGAGRAYEIIRNSICYGNLNVKIALTHSGLSVGEDGGTHQAIEDISLMRTIPGMVVLVPSDATETEKAVEAAIQHEGPVYIRIGRPVVPTYTNEATPFKIGKANILKEGNKVCIFSMGLLTYPALQVAEELEKQGVSTTVVNMHTIKPIDAECILKMAKTHEHLFSLEEHSVIGGLGSSIAEVLVKEYPKKLSMLGVQDVFGESGKPDDLLDYHQLTAPKILANILAQIK